MGAVRVDNWPDVMRTYKTIAIHADSFTGNLLIEASLATTPGDNDWFTYYEQDFIRPDQTSPQYQNTVISNRDRVVWMRAVITTSGCYSGRLDRVLVL